MTTFQIIYLAGFIVGSVIRARYTMGLRRKPVDMRRRTALDMALVAIAGLGLMAPLAWLATPWLGFADYELPAAAGWAGTALFAGALALLWRSHADLGANWSALPEIGEGHTLVTAGVYGRIRHPMYAAHLLWAAAQAMLVANWLAGPALLVAFVPMYLVRAPLEEAMMLERFGEEYREYMSRTGRIIPRLGR